VSELRYWQRKARYSAVLTAVLWLALAWQRWSEGDYLMAALLLAAHVLARRDALRAHMALGKADR
jgi:hypothetical protein